MPQYLGFSTLFANKPKTTNAPAGNDGGAGGIVQPVTTGKKFKLVDQPLVVQDFINALNIRIGEKVGQPEYGTNLWNFVFDPNTSDVQFEIESELRRIGGLDPRLSLNNISAFPQENGILLEIQIAVVPFNQAKLISIFLDSQTNQALLQ